jgi:hypothetical protein
MYMDKAADMAYLGKLAGVRDIFERSFTSVSTAEKVLASYGIIRRGPVITRPTLTNIILDFLTEVSFTCPVAFARNSLATQQPSPSNLESQQTPQVKQRSMVESYKIKFGNPFPGEDYQTPNHGVELVYLFDGFHGHLAKIDEKEKSSETNEYKSLRASIDWTSPPTKEDVPAES